MCGSDIDAREFVQPLRHRDDERFFAARIAEASESRSNLDLPGVPWTNPKSHRAIQHVYEIEVNRPIGVGAGLND